MLRHFILATSLVVVGAAHAGLEEDFNAGRQAFRDKNLGQLAAVAAQLKDTPLAIYGRYWPVAVDVANGNETQIQDFLRDYPSDWLSDRIRLEYAKRLGKAQRWSEFRRESALVIEGDTELSCYRLQQRLGNNDALAVNEAKDLWFTGAQLPESCDPVFNVLLSKQVLSRENVWRRIQLALEANQFGLAQYLNRIFASGQGFVQRDMNDSLNKPAAFLDRLTGSIQTRGQQEMVVAAIARLARNDAARAASYLQAVEPELSPAQKAFAWGRLGTNAAKRHDPAALGWFSRTDLSQLSDDEREWYVRAALRSYQWDTVAKVIRSMTPAEQAEASWRYWLARALKVQGQAIESSKIFAPLSLEHHFYGLLAREELETVVDTASGRYQASDSDVEEIAKQPVVQRALALYRIDARAEAIKEWNWSTRKLEDRQLIAAAELARREGWFDRAIYAADRTKYVHDFSLRYLTPYRDITRSYAAQVNLDDAWVYGLIRQESRFVSHAKSGVGASGLMQLMPTTAAWVARKLGLRGYSPTAVNEIGTNVQLGTYYLRSVLDQLGSQPVLATAAYNAGPGRARAWQANAPLEGAIYAETIPFTETRDYVKKVMANAQYYAYGFGEHKLTLKQRLGTIPAKP